MIDDDDNDYFDNDHGEGSNNDDGDAYDDIDDL